jgi:hypothetical protein
MSDVKNLNTATLPTNPTAYLPWYAVPRLRSITATSAALILTVVVSGGGAVAACFMLLTAPGWLSCAIAVTAGSTGVVGVVFLFRDPTRKVHDRAQFFAEFADKFNYLVAQFFAAEQEKDRADPERAESLKAAITSLSQKPPTSLTQFNGLIDILCQAKYTFMIRGVLDLLREMAGRGHAECKFVLDCLDRSHGCVRRYDECRAVLAEIAAACRGCTKKEAEQLHKIILNILFKETRFFNNQSEPLHAAVDWIVQPLANAHENEKQLTKIRGVFEIQSFDGLSANRILDNLIKFLKQRKRMTFVQFCRCFDKLTRENLLHNIAHNDKFPVAYGTWRDADNKFLKQDLGPEEFHRLVFRLELLGAQIDILAQKSSADLAAYFTGGDTRKQSKAFVRAVLRYCDKETVKQLFGIIATIGEPGRQALRGVYTPGFVGRRPFKWREGLARALGYEEAEVRAMKKDWRGDEALRRAG